MAIPPTYLALEYYNYDGALRNYLVTPYGTGSYAHSRNDYIRSGARSQNVIVKGAGIGAQSNSVSLAGKGSATAFFETIVKPVEEPPLDDNFTVLIGYLGHEPLQYLTTKPMLATYARNYYGTDATFGAAVGASKIVYPESLIASEGMQAAGYVNAAVASYYYEGFYHHSSYCRDYRHPGSIINPAPAGIIAQEDYVECLSYSLQLVNLSAPFTVSSIVSNTLQDTPILLAFQSSKLLMAAAPPAVDTGYDLPLGGSLNTGDTRYRKNTDVTSLGLRYWLTTALTWRDVTNYPTIGDAVELQVEESSPPLLIGLGHIVSVAYGNNFATNARAYTMAMKEFYIDTAYRVADSEVSNVYNAVIEDPNGSCVFQWVSGAWVLITDDCFTGRTATEPGYSGTVEGELAAGTCTI